MNKDIDLLYGGVTNLYLFIGGSGQYYTKPHL